MFKREGFYQFYTVIWDMYYNIFYLKNSTWNKYIKTKYIWYNHPIVLSSLEKKNTKCVWKRERKRSLSSIWTSFQLLLFFHSHVFKDSAPWLLFFFFLRFSIKLSYLLSYLSWQNDGTKVTPTTNSALPQAMSSLESPNCKDPRWQGINNWILT